MICKFSILFFIVLISIGTVSSTVTTFDLTVENSNITYINTTLKYNSTELLNGWNPSNVVHIHSGGSSNYLKSPDKKQAMRYTTPISKNVTKISLLPCCYFPVTSQPNWTIGLQLDNGGEPSGTYLGSGILYGPNISDEVWQTVNISPEVSCLRGNTYWIVAQYHSGPEPTSNDHWIGFRAEAPSKYWMSDNNPLPYNYISSKNINDEYTTTVLHYDGVSWASAGERNLGVFMLTFDDDTYHGQPYRHRYFDIYGNYQAGEVFTIYSHSKTINKLDAPFNAYDNAVEGNRPADDLYYHIKENDYSGATIASGTFLTKEDVRMDWGGSASDRRWYNTTIEPPIILEKNKTYFLYFTSPNTSSNPKWLSDAGDTFGAFPLSSYDQTSSYFRRTENNWSTTKTDINRDLSFRLHLIDIYSGNITSITKDAESIGSAGDVWKQINYTGTTPSGTNVSLYVNSSSGYILVQNEAVSGTTYNIPIGGQQRNASWRMVYNTNNSSASPEISTVNFIASAGDFAVDNTKMYYNQSSPITMTVHINGNKSYSRTITSNDIELNFDVVIS